MQMYEVTALAPEGPEEVYQAMVFAEDEDDASEPAGGTAERAGYCPWNVHGGRSVV